MKHGIIILLLLVTIGAVLGTILLRRQPSSFNLLRGGESTKEVIIIEGEDAGTMKEKEIMVIDGVRHSVPPKNFNE
tara:strand:+ start:2269 stop:2496 length:228 start_codon:yes stop_codon:yes gene_type:complete